MKKYDDGRSEVRLQRHFDSYKDTVQRMQNPTGTDIFVTFHTKLSTLIREDRPGDVSQHEPKLGCKYETLQVLIDEFLTQCGTQIGPNNVAIVENWHIWVHNSRINAVKRKQRKQRTAAKTAGVVPPDWTRWQLDPDVDPSTLATS